MNKFIHEYEAEQERIKLKTKKGKILEILYTIGYDFLPLINIPDGLTLGGIYKNCKFCHSNLNGKDYYISYNAIKHTYYICVDCLKKRDSLGRGQPSSKYKKALKYSELFDEQFDVFSNMFLEHNNESVIFFSRDEIKKIFIENINSVKLFYST